MYIGIDLGTSNSAIAGVDNGTVRVFRPADGGEALPSVIYLDKRGHRLYGRRAYDMAMVSPENVASGFKRLMGTATPISVQGAGVTLTPEECSADIIRQLVGQASTETGLESFAGAVIAIPASFNQMQAEATLRAAKDAGLDRVDLIQEPVAAALTSMAGTRRPGKFLIYDLGGGTFDLALVQAEQGKFSILAQQGVNMMGGRDFDRMIVSEIVRPWLSANFDLPEKFLADPLYARLKRIALLAAERAKIDLSTLDLAAIFASDDEVRLLDQSEAEIFLDAPVTRAQFEELIRKPIEQTVGLIHSLLKENDLTTADIDRVVFVGGPSRIPLVRRLVTESLDIPADLKTDPMSAVAEGAAYYCESRTWNGHVSAKQTREEQKETTPEKEEISEPSDATEPVLEESLPETVATEDNEPDIFFDFDLRTPRDTVAFFVRVEVETGGRTIRLLSGAWDSGALALKDSLEITAPLAALGENVFDVRVCDSKGDDIDAQSRVLTVTRTVAEPLAIPAAHAIAVKVLAAPDAEENTFLYLVQKGDTLPASGEISVRSGATLKAGASGHIGFEVFQVEYPERVEINLCVGLFRIDSADLPVGQGIRKGDPVLFTWRMNEGGILEASVKLPVSGLELQSPRFYAPQAGQISYAGADGESFARAILGLAREEWGDLAAAAGPSASLETGFLKARLDEQLDVLNEAAGDAEILRRVSEEARFIRQDTARLGQKYAAPLLQRRLGKTQAAFNRVCRGKAEDKEIAAFDALIDKAQRIIDEGARPAFLAAAACIADMRKLFFVVAWRDARYVRAWFDKLSREPWLFADQKSFQALVEKGKTFENDLDALRDVVFRLQEARISLGASDAVNELATIFKE